MSRGRDHWLNLARSSTPDDLREQILTGYQSGKPFTPYEPTIALPSSIGRVLDFGCGVGRSFPYLKRIARHVTGFDLAPMIERCRELAPVAVDRLDDDWNSVRAERFDLIAAVLVLQHLEPALCRQYLEDFARMSPLVYVLTRATSDFPANVFDLVTQAGLYEADEPIEVEHDPETHQLRALGRVPFDVARRMSEGRHYEVLLRARK